MSDGFLIIGVGGAGKGVVNWLKRNIQTQGCRTKNVHFLVIDSSENDQYALKDKPYFFDFQNEFYKTGANVQDVYNKRRKGESYNKFIDKWLSEKDAKDTPDNALNAAEGRAQNRVAGRVDFFLNIDNIYYKINNSIQEMARETVGINNPTYSIFIVGSSAGGSGSGMFLDVSILTKYIASHILPQDKTVISGIAVLPEAFNRVLNNPNEGIFKDARSFAFYRELSRLMSDEHVSIEYKDSIKVDTSSSIFNLCFIVGNNESVRTDTVIPVYGIAPAIADFIYAMIQEQGNIFSDLNNDQGKINRGNLHFFSSFGVCEYLFDLNGTVETFKYMLARDFFSKLIEENEQTYSSRNKTRDFLYGTTFTRYIIDFKEKTQIQLEPPVKDITHLYNMINSLTIINSIPFPSSTEGHRITQLKDEVDHTTSFFHRVSNETVVNETKDLIKSYLGENGSRNTHEVRGWVEYQTAALLTSFSGKLNNAIKDMFFDEANKKYKTLTAASPNVLIIANNFLDSLRNDFKNFADRLETIIADYQKPGINPLLNQRNRVETLEKELMNDSNGTNTEKQIRYLEEQQKLLNLEIWWILLEGFKNIARSLSEITNRVWDLFGNPVNGWVNTLANAVAEVSDKINFVNTYRLEYTNIPTRKYFPKPGSIAEIQMYNDFTKSNSKNYLDSLFNNIGWAYVENKVDKNKFELLLILPKEFVDNPLPEEISYVFSNEHTIANVEQFSTEKFYKKFEDYIRNEMKNLTIWDAIKYDREYNNNEVSDEDYFNNLLKIENISKPLLKTRQAIQGETIRREYIVGRFINDNEIAAKFNNHFKDKKVEGGSGEALLNIQFEHLIHFENWGYFEEIYRNYRTHIRNIFTKTGYMPVHIFNEEKNASKLEDGINRTKPYSPVVVKFLSDLDAIKYFTLAYALGILENYRRHLEDDPIKPEHYIIEGEIDGITWSKDLGEVDKMEEVLKAYLSEPNAFLIVKSKTAEYTSQNRNWKNNVRQAINSLNIRTGNETIKEELQDLIKAFILVEILR